VFFARNRAPDVASAQVKFRETVVVRWENAGKMVVKL
jgi:hypothetical protein